jgi:plastocyanin
MTTRIRKLIRLTAPAALLAIGLLAAPTASAGNPCFHDFTMPPADSATGNEVKLLPCAFAPTVTHVAVGTEVTFFNGPDFSHLITGANQAWGSPDVELGPGQKVSYTFDAAGIYPFACVLHPGMSGAIVVGDVAGAAAAPGAGTTSGGSTDASTGGGSNAAEAPTAATAQGSATDGLILAGLGIAAGLVAGVAAAWIALRRRPSASGRLATSTDSPLLGDPR